MQKKNIPFIISYILTIFFFFLAAMFYRQSFFAILVILLIVLPIISLVITTSVVRKIAITLSLEQLQVTQGNPIHLHFSIHNKTFFSLLNGLLSFQFQNQFYPSSITHELTFPLVGKSKEDYVLPFETAYCGMVTFDFEQITITDFLHLHTFSIPLKKHFEIPVLPDSTPISFQIPALAKKEADEEDLYLPFGEPTGDVKELREYRPGDKLKDIHWKLTAKADELMVKEFEQAAGYILRLLPLLHNESLDETLQTLYGTCHFLLKQREPFEVCLFDVSINAFECYLITEEETLLKVFYKLYYLTIPGSTTATLQAYRTQYGPEENVLQINGKDILIGEHAIVCREETTKSEK